MGVAYKAIEPLTPERQRAFWAKVDRRGADECWPWLAAKKPEGYGLFRATPRNQVTAHRVAYTLLRGPIPGSLTLDHLCRNPQCVNPAHLEPVSGKVNTLRGTSESAKNAVKTECKRGHPFSPENTKLVGGKRYCRTCLRMHWKAARQRGSFGG